MTHHSSPVTDTALPPVEEIARVMWESDHEGSWDDPHANPAMTRHIYMGNAEVALAVVRQWRPAAPEPLNAAMDDMRDPEVASRMRAEQALNDLRDERAETTAYAERLGLALWEKHFREDAPDWKPLYGDLVGILTQIDNMTTGLSRAPAQSTRWQPIETAPKDGTRILVGIKDRFPKNTYVARWLKDVWSIGPLGGEWHAYPSHWMPIPALTSTVQTPVENKEGGAS